MGPKVRNSVKANPTVSLTGGLGNQLFQLAAAMAGSKSTSVDVEWSLGTPRLSAQNIPEIFEFNLPPEITLLPSRSVSFFQRKLGNLTLRTSAQANGNRKVTLNRPLLGLLELAISLFYSRGQKTIICKGVGFDSGVIHATGNRFFVGYFQSYKWLQDSAIHRTFDSFRLVKSDSWLEDVKVWSQNENPLVLHLRMGDYENEGRIGIPRMEYYEQAVKELWGEGKYKKIWIFSDDPEKAKKLLPLWILENARWMTQNQDSAATTLEAMRYGTGYVMSNSTFSWWGAFLSYKSDATVVAPSPWFKLWDEPLEITPPHWKRQPAWP